MPDSLSQTFLNQAATFLADTSRGLSGSKIVQYCNAWSIDHRIDIPHSIYPFEAQSKRVALLQNLSVFPTPLQIGLLLELCGDWQFRANDEVQALRGRILEKKAEYEAENDWGTSHGAAPQTKPTPHSPHSGRTHIQAKANRLKVFLCHSSTDKEHVKKLHEWLVQEGYEPWLDEIDLLPGEDWEYEIKRAVRHTHIILVCLSKIAASRTGFMQKEIKLALDAADLRPEGEIFIIPALLESCEIPDRLTKWHGVNLSIDGGHDKLRSSLRKRYAQLPEN